MCLGTVKTICQTLVIYAGVFALLTVLTHLMVFFWIMLGLLIVYLIVKIRFWRCPACGKTLGYWGDRFCPACGNELEM